jgi:phosphopantetheine adenylyltransferase
MVLENIVEDIWTCLNNLLPKASNVIVGTKGVLVKQPRNQKTRAIIKGMRSSHHFWYIAKKIVILIHVK